MAKQLAVTVSISRFKKIISFAAIGIGSIYVLQYVNKNTHLKPHVWFREVEARIGGAVDSQSCLESVLKNNNSSRVRFNGISTVFAFIPLESDSSVELRGEISFVDSKRIRIFIGAPGYEPSEALASVVEKHLRRLVIAVEDGCK